MTFEQLWEAVHRQHAAGQPITPAPWEDDGQALRDKLRADAAAADLAIERALKDTER